MEEFILDKLMTIILGIASFGAIYILNNIKDSIQELKDDYRKLLISKENDKFALSKNIEEIRGILLGEYVKKEDFDKLFRHSMDRYYQHRIKNNETKKW